MGEVFPHSYYLMKGACKLNDIVITKRITPYTQLRKKRGWTQEFVAEHLGIHWRTLGNYEAGIRDAPKWVVVALDDLYDAHGELINYWINCKYSAETFKGNILIKLFRKLQRKNPHELALIRILGLKKIF